jgi:hypothetical protein
MVSASECGALLLKKELNAKLIAENAIWAFNIDPRANIYRWLPAVLT